MLAKVNISLLSKVFTRRSFQQLPKLYWLQRGYYAKLNNSGYFELAKQTLGKSRILIRHVDILKNEEVPLPDKKKTGICSVLWETVLVLIRIIAITSVFFGLLTYYWITRIFGINTFSDIYLKGLEILGPTFIKLGQWMSTRRDLYPEELCLRLSQLQRSASTHSWYYTKRALEAAYGPFWRQLFVEFNPEPVGSGCCAQVHRALVAQDSHLAGVNPHANISTLVDIAEFFYLGRIADFLGRTLRLDTENNRSSEHSSNLKPVAVKILHPRIKERLERDLSILRFFSKCITCCVPSLEWLSINDCINEFSQIMEKQVDLTFEAQNLETFSKHFSMKSQVKFPRPYYDLSSHQILVESFHEGRPINDYVYEENYRLRHELAKIGLTAVFKMIFVDNFIHCDLHPGNILVQENPERDFFRFPYRTPKRPLIVILDCGLVTQLTESCRRNFREVFQSVAHGDGKRAADLMMQHSEHQSPDPAGFIETMDKIVKSHLQKGMKLENSLLKITVWNQYENPYCLYLYEFGTEICPKTQYGICAIMWMITRKLVGLRQDFQHSINVGHVMSELFSAMVRYQVKQDGSFSSVILSIAVIEGLGRSLDPGIDLIHELTPFLSITG